MALLRTILIVILCLGTSAHGYGTSTEPGTALDSNVAYYQGENLTYVIYPPEDFQMVIDEAAEAGYSFAFIPDEVALDEADLMIGVNIYKVRGMAFDDVLARDTANMRKHYGESVEIEPVDSVFSSNGHQMPTFFIGDNTGFVPNVMISYFDGDTELLIFELVMTGRVARFKAEGLFLECLRRFKALSIGDLGYE